MEIFRLAGKPSEKHSFLFNGDFVDRGSWSTEIALLLYAYKWLYPDKFFLNRGNHETDDMNRMYGFEGECRAKYTERVFKLFSESFSMLPLATLIGKKYFVLHGGLFSDDKVTLDDVRKLDRFKQRQPGQAGLMMEMLWTDPQTAPGRVLASGVLVSNLAPMSRSDSARTMGSKPSFDHTKCAWMAMKSSTMDAASQYSPHRIIATALTTRVPSSRLAQSTSSSSPSLTQYRIQTSSPWHTRPTVWQE